MAATARRDDPSIDLRNTWPRCNTFDPLRETWRTKAQSFSTRARHGLPHSDRCTISPVKMRVLPATCLSSLV